MQFISTCRLPEEDHCVQSIYSVALLAAVLVLFNFNAAECANAKLAGSCDNSASGFCNDFTGAAYKAANVEKSCKKQKLSFRAGACPTEGRVGSCLVYKGKNSESYYRYYKNFPGFGIKPKGGVSAEAQKQYANMKGEWVPN